jgi:hypothetical protein
MKYLILSLVLIGSELLFSQEDIQIKGGILNEIKKIDLKGKDDSLMYDSINFLLEKQFELDQIFKTLEQSKFSESLKKYIGLKYVESINNNFEFVIKYVVSNIKYNSLLGYETNTFNDRRYFINNNDMRKLIGKRILESNLLYHCDLFEGLSSTSERIDMDTYLRYNLPYEMSLLLLENVPYLKEIYANQLDECFMDNINIINESSEIFKREFFKKKE